jgi:NAD(P)H-dependent FMN reductase
MSQPRILVLVGSLRSGSVNRRLAEAAVHAAPGGAEVVIYDGLGEVPFYNEDIDVPGEVPAAAEALRSAVAAADGLLLFTPEYNGTIPATLKNAVDWLSRPYGAGALKDKPVAVVSASISENAGRWAHGDTVKSVGVAGGAVVADAGLHFGAIGGRFAETHPRNDAAAVAELAATVQRLLDATRESVSA